MQILPRVKSEGGSWLVNTLTWCRCVRFSAVWGGVVYAHRCAVCSLSTAFSTAYSPGQPRYAFTRHFAQQVSSCELLPPVCMVRPVSFFRLHPIVSKGFVQICPKNVRIREGTTWTVARRKLKYSWIRKKASQKWTCIHDKIMRA